MRLPGLLALSPHALQSTMDQGYRVDPRALEGRWYRGISLGLWGWVEGWTWKTFAKTFHRDPGSEQVRGWNVRLHQEGLDAPPRPLERGGRPVCFGRYRALAEATTGGLTLDYSGAGNPWWDPSASVRDPIVAVAPGGPSCLLGRTLVQIGGVRSPTPSFFLLEDAGALPFVW